jgi:hypothetical protein
LEKPGDSVFRVFTFGAVHEHEHSLCLEHTTTLVQT